MLLSLTLTPSWITDDGNRAEDAVTWSSLENQISSLQVVRGMERLPVGWQLSCAGWLVWGEQHTQALTLPCPMGKHVLQIGMGIY